MSIKRSLEFKDRDHPRYWWSKATEAKYVPPIFSFLTDDEWQVLSDWYEETDRGRTGESGVPAMSMLMGLVMGNNMSRIVECGHSLGFSTMLLAFMLRHMDHRHGLVSIDIDPQASSYTDRWLERAGLKEHALLMTADSGDHEIVAPTLAYLGGAPHLVFIDSSHAYEHTVVELELWYEALQPGGFLVLHDVSEYAVAYDSTGAGGVRGAVTGWCATASSPHIFINDFCGAAHFGERTVYKDSCGLGIIQKPS